MLFLAGLFAVISLVLFIVAFSHVLKGRIGAAVVSGLLALLMGSIAGAAAVFGR